MVKIILLPILLCLTTSMGFAADIVAKAGTWGWTLSVNAEGDEWEESCKLDLVAETHLFKHEISLKRDNVNCALFGPVHLYAAEATDGRSVIVFFEAARGGDGDHSGPIIEVFKLTKLDIEKLGEQKLFDATYHRKKEQITSVTGNVLYGLCYVCDGPDSSDPEDNFYIPAKIIVGTNGISVKPALSEQERKALLKKFERRTKIVLKENENDKNFLEFIKIVRKNISTFLGQQH